MLVSGKLIAVVAYAAAVDSVRGEPFIVGSLGEVAL
jgi:hypothetical protein